MIRRLVLGLLLFAIACGDDDPYGASTTTGAYSLRTINGEPLPYTITTGASAGTVIVDEVIRMYQGGTFAATRHFRATVNGPIETRHETGSYGLLGTSITFNVNETGKARIAIGDGTRMTFTEPGLSLYYSK